MIIARGAEATIVRTKDGIRKERPQKRYRHVILDTQLRTTRTRAELKVLQKASSAGVPVPAARQVDETTLLLEDLPGTPVADVLDAQPELAQAIGAAVAKLHDADLVHGDLTTSNIIAHDGKVTLIDFGLAQHSKRIEDKAVDLHVLKQSVLSRHHAVLTRAWRAFLKGYATDDAEAVLDRLKKVERRGRNKGS